ncbi:MAG TPA: hypothetical protein VF591_11665 [Pyrinomonadaceae bacterium]|jgi:hypothetical protein
MKLLPSALRLLALTCLLSCGAARHEPAAPGPKQGDMPKLGDVPKQGGEPKQSDGPKQSDRWRLYVPPDKSFSVELPCDAERTNVSATSRPIYEYGCMGDEASGLIFFNVEVLNLSDAERAKMRDPAAFERSVRDSFTPNHRILKLTTLDVAGGVGREVFVSNTEDDMDNMRGRVIIFGGRRYDVAFGATAADDLQSAAAERFFATFKPLE